MEDEYITNMNTNVILDENEIIQKLKKAEEELVEVKKNLDEKNKLCLSQKHKIEDFTIEMKNLNDKIKNQGNLIKFYQDKLEQEVEEETDPEKKDKIKQLEIKNMKLSEKIMQLEEEKIKLDNDYDVIQQQLDEEKAINQKALELINEKDDEIEELKNKIEGGGDTQKGNIGGLSEEEVQALKEEFLNQSEEFNQYKEESNKKINQYINENNSLMNEISDLKDKNAAKDFELSKLKETNERLENEKRINEKILEEKNLKEDSKVNEFIVEIQNLQTQLEETQKKNADNLEKQREASKYEREEFEKMIAELKKKNSEFEDNIKSLDSDLKKKRCEN